MAEFVWTDRHGRGRNRFVLFRRRFVADRGASAWVRVFADSRYRLLINGATAAHGPARFFRNQPEYDEIDLTAYLREGENVLAVVVHSPGDVCFQAEASTGALWVSGVLREADGSERSLDTAQEESGAVREEDRGWVGLDSPGHRADVHDVSFALGPAEYLDLRAMPRGWDRPGFDDRAWGCVLRLERPEYGPLRPRSIPMLDEREVVPLRRVGVFAGRTPEAEDVYSLCVARPGRTSHDTSFVAAATTFVFSPVRQDVTFVGWWGRYALGGDELTPVSTDASRRRQVFEVSLAPGWTPLVCLERFAWGAWELYLRFPQGRGIELSAVRKVGSPELFRVVGPLEATSAQARTLVSSWPNLSGLLEGREGWMWPRDRAADLPHRDRANRIWGRSDTPEGGSSELSFRGDDLPHGTESVAVVYDLGRHRLGRAKVRLTAPRGTRIDLGYAETLAADGTAGVHQHDLIDPCERYIASGDGVETVHAFHPRGGRYLEVVITPPSDAAATGSAASLWDAVRVHDVGLTLARYPAARWSDPQGNLGRFACSDPMLEQIWTLGARTLEACMEDAYLDCPFRERGMYVGDVLVQFHVNLMTFGDTRLLRRCLELFFRSARESSNGLVAGGCHGLPAGLCPDYSALMSWGLRAYHDATGDADFLRQMRPGLERLLLGLESMLGEQGLADASGRGAYVDTARHDHDGISAPVNAFLAGAFREAGRVYQRLGDAAGVARWQGAYERLRSAFHNAFFDSNSGLYLDRRRADVPSSQPSVHGNTLGVLFELAPPEVRPRVLTYLKRCLRENASVKRVGGKASAFAVSSYFSFYTLTALAEAGEWPAALEAIRDNWSAYVEAGSSTVWEYFSDDASLCHAWSGCPTYLLSRYALGVSFPEPGDLSRVRVKPDVRGLSFAEGVVPHPGGAGPIWVSWERIGSGAADVTDDETAGVRLQVRLPRGVVRVP